MQNSTKVSLLSNNKFLIKNSEFIAGVYNTGEVGNNAIFEYKKYGKNLMIRCLEREKWKDLEWDEIPEDTWIEKYNIFIIKEGKLDKDVIKEYSLEHIEKELEEFCEWQDFNIKKIGKILSFTGRRIGRFKEIYNRKLIKKLSKRRASFYNH